MIAATVSGQMVLNSGTAMNVAPGTDVRIESPVVFTVQSGAVLVNDGHIAFGALASLNEVAGSPVVGAGTESTARSYPSPLLSTAPAGLGFSFTTAAAPDSFIVERGHLPHLNNQNAQSIARWYHVRSGNVAGLGATGALSYDLTELNGIPEAALRIARNGNGGPWWPELSSTVDLGLHNATAALPDSLGWFTLFDDAVISTTGDLGARNWVFQLAPSLVEDHLTIRGAERIENVALFDAAGKLLQLFNGGNATCLVLATTALRSGAYFVQVNNIHRLRFVKP
ncbi:MAG: T9SS type A sorting domain-containing protein [Flavobacteriales bacterium]